MILKKLYKLISNSYLVKSSDFDWLDLVLEWLNPFNNIIHRNLFILARKTNDKLKNPKSNWLFFILFPKESIKNDFSINLFSELIKICLVIQRFNFEQYKGHSNHFFFLALFGVFSCLYGLLYSFSIIFIISKKIIEFIFLRRFLIIWGANFWPKISSCLSEVRCEAIPCECIWVTFGW